MRLARGYLERLRRFDRELRLRWSHRRQVWLLERRAGYQRLDIDPERYGRAEHDTVTQLRDGFFTLGIYQPRDLPSCDHLIAYLRSQDVWRGGDQDLDRLANAVADDLDRADELRETTLRDQALRDVADRSGELWDHDRWRFGERVTVPRALPTVRAMSDR